MKCKTLLNLLATLSLILASMLALFSAPVVQADSTPAGPDTVLFDHFENSTLAGYSSGAMNYVDGPSGFGRAADFSGGNWIKYSVPGWYQWPWSYDPTGKQGTVELWVYPKQYGIGLVNFNWNDSTSYPSAGHILHLQINAEGKLAAGTWTAVVGPPTPLTPLPTGSTTIPLNQWTHVAFTWGDDGSKVYVNGMLDASTPSNLYPALNSTFYVYVPYWGGSDIGYIDEFHILKTQVTYSSQVTGSQITATTASAEVYPGDPVSVTLTIENADNLYAAQATCTVDPDVLQPQSAVFGDFFDPVNRLIGANQVDAATGTWTGAISQRNPAGPLSGDGNFATITYEALSPGTTTITCDPLFSNRDGFELPVSFVEAEITVLPFAVVNGTATYQGRLSHEGIGVIAIGPITRTALTDTDGAFTLDELRAGAYDVQADADLYLPNCTTFTVAPGDTLTLPDTMLLGGDLNADDVINIGDATRLGAGFGTSDPGADINADDTVNVQDLAILGGNYELSGCQSW